MARSRAGHPLSYPVSPHHSLREHPQPSQHLAGSVGGLRTAYGCGCPSLIHRQMCVTTPRTATRGPGGCAGSWWPGDAINLGRPSICGGRVTGHHCSPARGRGCPKPSPDSPAARRESETRNSGQPLCLDQTMRGWGSKGKIKPLLRNSFIPGSSRVSCFGPFICPAD